MSIYELSIFALSNNATLHTNLQSKIPAKLDTRIWLDTTASDEGYSINTGDIGGIPFTNIEVRFNDEADRTAVINQINALVEFKTDCEIGSYVKYHLCNHDNKSSCSQATTYWEKT